MSALANLLHMRALCAEQVDAAHLKLLNSQASTTAIAAVFAPHMARVHQIDIPDGVLICVCVSTACAFVLLPSLRWCGLAASTLHAHRARGLPKSMHIN